MHHNLKVLVALVRSNFNQQESAYLWNRIIFATKTFTSYSLKVPKILQHIISNINSHILSSSKHFT